MTATAAPWLEAGWVPVGPALPAWLRSLTAEHEHAVDEIARAVDRQHAVWALGPDAPQRELLEREAAQGVGVARSELCRVVRRALALADAHSRDVEELLFVMADDARADLGAWWAQVAPAAGGRRVTERALLAGAAGW